MNRYVRRRRTDARDQHKAKDKDERRLAASGRSMGRDLVTKTLILSDLHMAAGKRCLPDPAMLRPLWRDVDALVLNGDVAEVHHVELRAHAARLALRLIEMCEDDGVAVTILAGNHDPYISDLRHVVLGDGQVLVTHGDAFHPDISPWCPHARRLRDQYAAAMERLDPIQRKELAHRLDAARFASHMEWLTEKEHRTTIKQLLARPTRVLTLLRYWRDVPHLANQWAQEHTPDARFVVFGHTHRQGVWHIGGRTVINTGSFGFPGRPQAVVLDDADATLTMWPLVRRGKVYDYATRPRGQWGLGVDDDAVALVGV